MLLLPQIQTYKFRIRTKKWKIRCASMTILVFVGLRKVANGSTIAKNVKIFQCALISKNVQKDTLRCAEGLTLTIYADSRMSVPNEDVNAFKDKVDILEKMEKDLTKKIEIHNLEQMEKSFAFFNKTSSKPRKEN